MTTTVRERRLHAVYVCVRIAALLGFLGAALVLPPGPWAGVVVLVCGVAGIAACIGTTAGGRGEHASALAEQRRYERLRAPQGDWPPYADPELPRPRAAAPAPLLPEER